jgi:hypothetical protein
MLSFVQDNQQFWIIAAGRGAKMVILSEAYGLSIGYFSQKPIAAALRHRSFHPFRAGIFAPVQAPPPVPYSP